MFKLIALARSLVSRPPLTSQLIRTFGECCCCHTETVVVTQVTSDGSNVEHSPMVCATCFDRTLECFATKEVLQ